MCFSGNVSGCEGVPASGIGAGGMISAAELAGLYPIVTATKVIKCISQDLILQTASPHQVYAANIFSFANGTLSRNVCIGVLP